MTQGLPIYFHYADVKPRLQRITDLKKIVKRIFLDYKVALNRIDYIFTSDAYLHNINLAHLDHDTYTDIITFPMQEEGQPVIGEIYISIDRVRDNARTFGVSFTNELARVVFHGALHLCGLKDKNKAQQETMRAAESKYLTLL